MSSELITSIVLALSNMATAWGWIATVRKNKSEAKKLDAETQQITRSFDKQIVDEYRETMVNPWKQEVRELRAEEKRLRKAVRSAYNCRYSRGCPVCKQLLDEDRGGKEVSVSRVVPADAARGTPVARNRVSPKEPVGLSDRLRTIVPNQDETNETSRA